MSARPEKIDGAPGFYRRGSRVVFQYRDDRGKQRWASAANLSEARRRRREVLVDVDRGEHTPRTRETFGEYARAWIATYAGRTSRGVRPETRADYLKRLEHDAIPFLGHLRLSEIRPTDVKALAIHVAERGVSQNTVRLALAPVKACLATAAEEGLIRSNPAHGLRVATGRELSGDPTQRVQALDDDELGVLLDELPETWRLFFAFLAETGLRIGEAIEVRWQDIDLGQRILTISRRYYRGRVDSPKTKYGHRTIRLSRTTARALWRLQAEQRPESDALVFTAEKGGRIDGSNLMTDVLKPAAVRAGLGAWVVDRTAGGRRAKSWVGFHSFRHTCGTRLFRAGWNAAQVQLLLGHHSPAFTLSRYIHLLPNDLPEPIEAPGVQTKVQTRQPKSAQISRPSG